MLTMNRTIKHFILGLSTGVTVFVIVVPLIHMLAELATFVGVTLVAWDNPVEAFIFVMTAAVFGIFPWGLWIVLTDARRADLFNEDHGIAEYLLAAMGVFLILTLLVCTRFQYFYASYRWFCTPILLVCAAALLYWRWTRILQFPKSKGFRKILNFALALDHNS